MKLPFARPALTPPVLCADLHMARDSLREMLQQVRKRRRAVEVHDLARGFTGSRAAGAIGAAVAEGAAMLERGGGHPVAQGARPKLVRQASDRSSLEAAAQGAWSAVNGFMSMIPAARTAAKPPAQAATPPPSIPENDEVREVIPPPAVTGGSADFSEPPLPAAAAGGGGSGDSPWKGAKLMEDLDEVDDDEEDAVPLAFVGDSSDSSRETTSTAAVMPGRYSEGLPLPHSNRVAHGTGRQTVFVTPGYKMRKRSSGGGSTASSLSPGVTPPAAGEQEDGPGDDDTSS